MIDSAKIEIVYNRLKDDIEEYKLPPSISSRDQDIIKKVASIYTSTVFEMYDTFVFTISVSQDINDDRHCKFATIYLYGCEDNYYSIQIQYRCERYTPENIFDEYHTIELRIDCSYITYEQSLQYILKNIVEFI